MEQIASKNTITGWSCLPDGKEKIEFGLFDFSPDQIAYLDRCLRAEKPQVRLTLVAEQGKLQIEDIVAVVRLVNVSLRTGGQKVKFADFKSPPTRAQALKALTQNATPLLVTIEEYQKSLPFNQGDTQAGDSPGLASYVKTISFGRGRRERVELAMERPADGDRRLRALCRTAKDSEVLHRSLTADETFVDDVSALQQLVTDWFGARVNDNAMTMIAVGISEGFDAWCEDLDAGDR